MTRGRLARKINRAKEQGVLLAEGETLGRVVRLKGSARPSGDETEESKP